MTPATVTHGRSAYIHHGCRCDVCRGEAVKYQQRMRANRRKRVAAGKQPVIHGTATGYLEDGCRCAQCCDAQDLARLMYLAKKFGYRLTKEPAA